MSSEAKSMQEALFGALPVPLQRQRAAKGCVGIDHVGIEFNGTQRSIFGQRYGGRSQR